MAFICTHVQPVQCTVTGLARQCMKGERRDCSAECRFGLLAIKRGAVVHTNGLWVQSVRSTLHKFLPVPPTADHEVSVPSGWLEWRVCAHTVCAFLPRA